VADRPDDSSKRQREYHPHMEGEGSKDGEFYTEGLWKVNGDNISSRIIDHRRKFVRLKLHLLEEFVLEAFGEENVPSEVKKMFAVEVEDRKSAEDSAFIKQFADDAAILPFEEFEELCTQALANDRHISRSVLQLFANLTGSVNLWIEDVETATMTEQTLIDILLRPIFEIFFNSFGALWAA
ncbi:hypothetical protein BX616_005327, partial [Lobosporangium transversale]